MLYLKRHNVDMENDFAAAIQKYILYVLLVMGLFVVLGLVVFLIKLIF